jgi:TonB family protein
MDDMLVSVGVYSVQVAVVIAVAAVAELTVRLRPGSARLAFWRFVVFACLLLPIAPDRPAPVILAPVVSGTVAGVGAAMGSTGMAPAAAGNRLWWLLVAGGLLRAAWLGTGVFRLQRLRHDATPAVMERDIEALRRRIAPRAAFYWHARVEQPITFGLRRPVVLLPPAVAELSSNARRAILCHELLHVARRDWAWLWLEEAVRTIFWFHPPMRWALRRVQLGREQAIDASVVLLTGVRRDYLDALVRFAAAPRVSAPAMSLMSHGDLTERVTSLLQENTMSRKRLVLAGAILTSAVVVSMWGVKAAVAEIQSQALGVEQSGTTPLALTRVEASYPEEALPFGAAGDVVVLVTVDGAGFVVNDRTSSWALQIREGGSLDTPSAREEARLSQLFIEAARDAARQWRFEASGASWTSGISFAFRPPPAPRQEAATAATTVEGVAGTARPGEVASPPPPPPPPPPPGPVRVGYAGIRPPLKTYHVNPTYPAEAREAGLQGVVILDATIDTNGTVRNLEVLRSVPGLDEAAMAAARQWRFEPPLLNGQPVDVVMTLTINFTLQ